MITEYAWLVFSQIDEYGDRTFFVFVDQDGCGLDGKKDILPERRWRLITRGWKSRVVDEICHRAGATEAGRLVLETGRTTPEKYLRLWRERLSQSHDLAELLATLPIQAGVIILNKTDPQPDDHNSFILERLAQIRQAYRCEGDWEDGCEKWTRPITSAEDFLKWVDDKYFGVTDWFELRSAAEEAV